MTKRYAVYFAPARDSAWWRFGAHWLGRDEASGAALAQASPLQEGGAELRRITDEPRRYGFHATLKAPFRLRDNVEERTVLERVARLARGMKQVSLAPLVPVWMDGFVALVPARPIPALNALAEACVTGLDDLRAPSGADEIARRQPKQMDPRGQELFERFGYPLVLERFRFHMTLTTRIDIALAGQVVAQIAPSIARLNVDEPPVLDRLCVFVEPEPGAHFLRIADEELEP
jgi:putative phosphonate metabolism protein